jgi:hypothetical protein
VCRGIVKDFKVVIKFRLAINDTGLKVKVGFKGFVDVNSLSFDVVTPRLYVCNKVI